MTIYQTIKNVEDYDFECEGGLLINCFDWIKLKNEIYMLEIEDQSKLAIAREAKKFRDSMDIVVTEKGAR